MKGIMMGFMMPIENEGYHDALHDAYWKWSASWRLLKMKHTPIKQFLKKNVCVS